MLNGGWQALFSVIVEEPVPATFCESDSVTESSGFFRDSRAFPLFAETAPGWQFNSTIFDASESILLSPQVLI